MTAESAVARPGPALTGLVTRYVGYRYEGLRPGTHLGMPSPSLTVVLSLAGPTRTVAMPDPAQSPADLTALVGGLHTRPAVIAHDGTAYGVQLELTPAGARSLLGLPTAELGALVLPLEDLLPLGPLLDRMREAPTWPERFALLDDALSRRAGRLRPVDPVLARAWDRLATGRVRVADIAAEVALSRRHLGERFRQEYGLAPKTLARVARFDRSRTLLQSAPRRLADVAAVCGFADQAHLARDWNDLVGVPAVGLAGRRGAPVRPRLDAGRGARLTA